MEHDDDFEDDDYVDDGFDYEEYIDREFGDHRAVDDIPKLWRWVAAGLLLMFLLSFLATFRLWIPV
ncbi:hypothetical protein [Rhodopirellula sp. MGV]|uniref:hypothetical protein n=1 Tax=Rhodopirellula sp. MGV TaxID=2023130 RepID=UPI000B9625D8|nr:hypothetical protein [Rhodopirellula sp. MGV]OYP37898.1 hypothetical protein CGZ80_04005 [Rhodopirellula sp. MGV]PNY37075.1 hypothetical protein C2E31_09515 [Rhodopirellula baltica]